MNRQPRTDYLSYKDLKHILCIIHNRHEAASNLERISLALKRLSDSFWTEIHAGVNFCTKSGWRRSANETNWNERAEVQVNSVRILRRTRSCSNGYHTRHSRIWPNLLKDSSMEYKPYCHPIVQSPPLQCSDSFPGGLSEGNQQSALVLDCSQPALHHWGRCRSRNKKAPH